MSQADYVYLISKPTHPKLYLTTLAYKFGLADCTVRQTCSALRKGGMKFK